MRVVRFRWKGEGRLGLVEDDAIRLFSADVTRLEQLLGLERSAQAALLTAGKLSLTDVTLLSPVRSQKNIVCVGRNYMGHAEEVARARGTSLNLPSVPTFFTKASTAIADPGATLHLSAELSSQYDWEAELAAVIGTRCRDVAEADAPEVIFGYTCVNDVTARDLQKAHGQWFKGKSLDNTCPLGPWIVTADEVGDPQQLKIALRVDGTTKQSSHTSQMIFNVKKIVASLSTGMTLEAGDVIATGTPDGVGFARNPPEFLRDGQVMEVEIERVGILRNRVSLREK